jgi:hypothetical protein
MISTISKPTKKKKENDQICAKCRSLSEHFYISFGGWLVGWLAGWPEEFLFFLPL